MEVVCKHQRVKGGNTLRLFSFPMFNTIQQISIKNKLTRQFYLYCYHLFTNFYQVIIFFNSYIPLIQTTHHQILIFLHKLTIYTFLKFIFLNLKIRINELNIILLSKNHFLKICSREFLVLL